VNREADTILTVGFSPCPNDTFIFNAMVNGPVSVPGHSIEARLHDVETLNGMAFDAVLDMTKLSFYAWLNVRADYRLLSSGGALGFGCGPVVVSRRAMSRDDMAAARIVLPGQWTTAHLLFRLWAPEAEQRSFVPYDAIFETLRRGDADCGVIIHESRFTFREEGFCEVVDLGAWWESRTGLPIPLGCIAVHRRHPERLCGLLEEAIRKSIALARRDPQTALPFIKAHAREMSADVLDAHIDTFVNEFSLDLGALGREAVLALEGEAHAMGILP
jgi:1,4-dihydroxy-6-naphthoate synthase